MLIQIKLEKQSHVVMKMEMKQLPKILNDVLKGQIQNTNIPFCMIQLMAEDGKDTKIL